MRCYEKIKVIDAGTFGIVYLAKYNENRDCVVKEISLIGRTEEEIQSQQREAQILAKVAHPNIIKFIDTFKEDDTLSIVMEYAPIGTLHDYLQGTNELLEESKVLTLFSQIVLAMDYLHDIGIIHRDLSARNILFLKGSKLKISDFGLARSVGSEFEIAGDFRYFAPELFKGKLQSKASDIWAVGCNLYYMLTLKLPYNSGTLEGMQKAVLNTIEPEPIDSQYSIPLWRLVDDCLLKTPAARPTARNLLCHEILTIYIHQIMI